MGIKTILLLIIFSSALVQTKEFCKFDDKELSINGSNRSPVDLRWGYAWKNGKIPYYFNGVVLNDDKTLIKRVMGQIEARTCFRFEEIPGHPTYHHLEITVGPEPSGTDCIFSAEVTAFNYPKVTMESFYQLADTSQCDNTNKGGILHELMHVLGVGHTQKRRDRDDYIKVHRKRIQPNAYSQYAICYECPHLRNIPYDCDSIMHYGYASGLKEEYTGSQGKTMTARDPKNCKLTAFGPHEASTTDWKLLNVIGDKMCQEASESCGWYNTCLGVKEGTCPQGKLKKCRCVKKNKITKKVVAKGDGVIAGGKCSCDKFCPKKGNPCKAMLNCCGGTYNKGRTWVNAATIGGTC